MNAYKYYFSYAYVFQYLFFECNQLKWLQFIRVCIFVSVPASGSDHEVLWIHSVQTLCHRLPSPSLPSVCRRWAPRTQLQNTDRFSKSIWICYIVFGLTHWWTFVTITEANCESIILNRAQWKKEASRSPGWGVGESQRP